MLPQQNPCVNVHSAAVVRMISGNRYCTNLGQADSAVPSVGTYLDGKPDLIVTYGNGELCNGQHRSVALVFRCSPEQISGSILSVRETSVCNHEIVLAAASACAVRSSSAWGWFVVIMYALSRVLSVCADTDVQLWCCPGDLLLGGCDLQAVPAWPHRIRRSAPLGLLARPSVLGSSAPCSPSLYPSENPLLTCRTRGRMAFASVGTGLVTV
jgi:hypothetical protein